MEIRGRTALVTGASSGIGRATAVALHDAGATVRLTGRNEDALNAVAERTRGHWLAADLADPEAPQRLAAWAGDVDILVNNAGYGLAGPFESATRPEVERIVQVNVLAAMELTRLLLTGMRDRDLGHVVNMASIAGHVGVRGEAVYAATKAALIAFGESLRFELQASGVGVTTVSPGIIATEFFDREGLPYRRRFPRPLPPERVANAVVDALRHDRAQVYVPRWLAFPVWLRGALPWLYRQGASRWG
jgi:short-subunit dehydrogenase